MLLSINNVANLGTVLPKLVGSFKLIFFSSVEDAVFMTLGECDTKDTEEMHQWRKVR